MFTLTFTKIAIEIYLIGGQWQLLSYFPVATFSGTSGFGADNSVMTSNTRLFGPTGTYINVNDSSGSNVAYVNGSANVTVGTAARGFGPEDFA